MAPEPGAARVSEVCSLFQPWHGLIDSSATSMVSPVLRTSTANTSPAVSGFTCTCTCTTSRTGSSHIISPCRLISRSLLAMSSPVESAPDVPTSTPSSFNYVLSFLLVGLCWGFTTPFIRRAAVNYTAPTNPSITDPSRSWLARQIAKAFFTVVGLVKKPSYAIPLVANLTGSIWFFLLVGQAGTCLPVIQPFPRRRGRSCIIN